MDDIAERKRVTQEIARQCGDAEIVVGIAPETIVWACWVGEMMGLPVAYVREPKSYGRQRTVEGGGTKGRRVVLITKGHDASLFTPHLEAASVKVVEIK